MTWMPTNGGAVLPIARFGRLGWYVEGTDARGNTWTMQPVGGALTLSEQRAIAQACAAVLRAAGCRSAAAVRDLVYAAADG
jgi:hypothetical protein